jgi:hypothetical protein
MTLSSDGVPIPVEISAKGIRWSNRFDVPQSQKIIAASAIVRKILE